MTETPSSPAYRDRCIAAYLAAAIWSSLHTPDPGENNEPEHFEDFHYKWAPCALDKARALVHRFLDIATGDGLLYGWEPGQLGHSLWLTQAGHGAGTWDFPAIKGCELAGLIDSHFKEFNPVIGDDGLTYLE